jgi:hypothetical protein
LDLALGLAPEPPGSTTLDAVLTYWPFAAKLEARGMRSLLSIGDTLAALGTVAGTPLTGYVTSARWAVENSAALDGLLGSSREAKALLASSAALRAPPDEAAPTWGISPQRWR